MLQIQWAPGPTVAIRTVGYGDGLTWRHFALSLDPLARSQDIASLHGLVKENPQPIEHTGSPKALASLLRWLRECDSRHECFNGEIPLLPHRVLHVKGDRVYVEDGQSRRALYVTLSYCWGDKSPLLLTTDNYDAFTQQGISLEDLPATYRDAVTIMRKLDVPIEYIWIDALCIVQNDKQDWDTEARRMRTVYGNTYLNITAAHATNCTQGCFSHCVADQRAHQPQQIDSSPVLIRELPRDLHLDFANNYRTQRPIPALQRGWIFQERLLASRVVYFDRNELLWECKDKHDCQCKAITIMSGLKDYWAKAVRPDNKALARFAKEHPVVAWMKMIRKYSHMQLTNDEDRLMALEGIAELVKLNLSSMEGYYCGLWRRNLDRQLTWFMLDTFRTTDSPIAPTWSWASKVGAIDFCDIPDWKLDLEGVEISGRILSVSPFVRGQDGSGVLVLEGSSIDVIASVVQEPPSSSPAELVLTDFRTGAFIGCAHGDVVDPGDVRGRQQHLVLLWWGRTAVTADDCDTFIILRPLPANGLYERYGLFPRFGSFRQEQQATRLAKRMNNKARARFKVT